MDILVEMINRQRQDHESMLRGIAAGLRSSLAVFRIHRSWLFHIELSNDIRGERLRFVEAMKEATAINIQGNEIASSAILMLSYAALQCT